MNSLQRLTCVVLMAGAVLPATQAFAVEGKEVAYVSGTVSTVKLGTVGALNTFNPEALVFESAAGQISIPYGRIASYQYRREVTVHLGVAAAIVVGLVKKRARRHFLTITWKGEHDEAEVVTLEVAKSEPDGLLALLHARATEASKTKSGLVCGQQAP